MTASQRQLSSSIEVSEMTEFTSDRIIVNDVPIYYEKRGTGDHVVLLLPGAMGTTTTDFLVQYKQMDLTKFTLICWDGE